MEINLLPERFIKDQTAKLIVIYTFFLILFMALVLGGLTFFKSAEYKNLEVLLRQNKLQEVKMSKDISDLRKQQSRDVQEALEKLRFNRNVLYPINQKIAAIADKNNVQILDYSTGLEVDQKGQVAIRMNIIGDLYSTCAKFVDELNEDNRFNVEIKNALLEESGKWKVEIANQLQKNEFSIQK